MTTAASRPPGAPAPAQVHRLGQREADRQALLLRVPPQSGEAAGRPINDPIRPAVPADAA